MAMFKLKPIATTKIIAYLSNKFSFQLLSSRMPWFHDGILQRMHLEIEKVSKHDKH